MSALLQLKFHEVLLARASEKGIMLHAACSPRDQIWCSAESPQHAGVWFAYQAMLLKGPAVDVFIQTGNTAENKQIFDALYAQKQEIERAFGQALDWQRCNDTSACRIRFLMAEGGIKAAKWPDVQDAMIDNMQKLANAVTPYLSGSYAGASR